MLKIYNIVFVIVFLSISTCALGDMYNNRNILPGDRAALMGGAYTALSEDVSGTYYNPAGIAYVKNLLIYVSADLYSYRNYERIGSSNTNKFEEVQAIPSSLGLVFNYKGFSAGVSMIQNDVFKFSDLADTATVSAKVEFDTVSYLIGPSFAYAFNKYISIGTSVFYHYYRGEAVISTIDTANTNVHIMQNDLSSDGITAVFGIRAAYKGFKMGITYGMETINIAGTNDYSNFKVTPGPSINNEKGTTTGDVRLPHRLSAGIAYEKKGVFTVSADFTWYFPLSYAAPREMLHTDESSWTHKERAHFDISVGAEIYVAKAWTINFGFFTNTSGADIQDLSERVDVYGGTIGYGFRSEKVYTTMGLSVSYGQSTSQTSVGPTNPATGAWKRFSLAFIIGASTNI